MEIQITQEKEEKLKELSRRTGKTVNEIINKAILKYLYLHKMYTTAERLKRHE